jgi:uncharacterized delta-60 repeat protein
MGPRLAAASVVPTAPDRVSFLGSLALQPGGEIVTGGSIGDISIRDFLLVRVTSTGAFDPSFGTDGIVRHSIGDSEGFGDVAVQPDGRIVAVGGTGDGSSASTRAVLMRFEDDGSLDATFGVGGIVTTAIASSAGALVLQPDGALVILAGNVIARFLDDGSPDPSFGSGGIVDAGHAVRALVRQLDGTLVAAGQAGVDAVAASAARAARRF